MAEFLPPSPGAARLRELSPELRTLPKGTRLLRIWFRGSSYPSGFDRFRFHGPTSARFDHHLPGPGDKPTTGDRGILYAMEQGSRSFTSALAEVFQGSRIIDVHDEIPMVSIFEITRDLQLLDLTGYWPTRAGASAAISSGQRMACRGWSRDFYVAYPLIDGLSYRSSMSGGSDVALALYERGEDAMPAKALTSRKLNHPEILGEVERAAVALGYDIRL